MKFILALAVIATVSASELTFRDIEKSEWDFSRHNYHRHNFYANKATIEEFNAEPGHTFRMALNEFAFMTPAEFIRLKCQTKVPEELLALINNNTLPPIDEVPQESLQSVDFSSLMQPVMRQGMCGACWAFSAMGLLEGLMNARNTSLPCRANFSPQYLIDCDPQDLGCESGWPARALRFLKGPNSKNEAPRVIDYPYLEQKRTCNCFAPRIPLSISRVTENFFKGDEAKLEAHVSANGPTIVAMYATNAFAFYGSGVFEDATCPATPDVCKIVNHAVIVVGYGTDPIEGDFWKVKNSYGTTWGEEGYFRIARNKRNMCGIACWAVNAY